MKRNEFLPRYKDFEFKEHFLKHVNSLLCHLYPNAEINRTSIKFHEGEFKGLSCSIGSSAIYPDMDKDFRERHPRFKKTGYYSFEELVNSGVKWTGSSGLGYMYPKDRNMFDDSELGMEQKAAFFIIVMQVCFRWMISNKI